MSMLEFRKLRKCRNYKVGDKVWFEYVEGFTSMGAVMSINVGIVEYLPDEYSVRYGIKPLDADEDTFCIIEVMARDMRKFRG